VRAARDVVLERIRAALDGAPTVPDVPRDYRQAGVLDARELAALFVARVEDTGATVVQTDDPGEALRSVLAEQGASRVVVPPDLPRSLRSAGVELVEDDDLSPLELDALDGVVTTCAAACAETGTIAFDGGAGQGRRAVTLVPDLHIVVVRHDQLVETVPELFERLGAAAREGRPLVLVSGPSATSDIGFERVEGVHGPRRLVVVLAFPTRP
jgi:L-lactate dehydrogenase complex protein LldG